MKRGLFFPLCLLALVLVPTLSYAIGIELGVGGWRQDVTGSISYKGGGLPSNDLDLERDMKFDTESRITARAKIDMPLVIPNVYIMYTPMSFKGTGSKSFKFGDYTFTGAFDGELKLDHYDVALYYGIPFVKTLTGGILGAELGINARVIDFEASVKEHSTGHKESKSMTLPVPMIYAGVQLKPFKSVAIEAEGRGIGYKGNSYYSVIGRLKIKPIKYIFIAGGYRYDTIKLDEEDVKADVKFSGPFAEAGIDW